MKTAATGQLASWCGPIIPPSEAEVAPVRHWLKKEAPGYFAMVAFLAAYLMSVAQVGLAAQTFLNLAGAGVAAIYLARKKALPSVISNVLWGLITLAGLLLRLAF